jgi:preprotein translocase subunit YajC
LFHKPGPKLKGLRLIRQPGCCLLFSLIPFILIFIVFYFLLILPQQRRQKKQRELLEAIKKGDKVITSSGIWGTVTNLDKETVTLQVADNTKIRLQRDHISSIRTSSES